jgi:hypothetical protein
MRRSRRILPLLRQSGRCLPNLIGRLRPSRRCPRATHAVTPTAPASVVAAARNATWWAATSLWPCPSSAATNVGDTAPTAEPSATATASQPAEAKSARPLLARLLRPRRPPSQWPRAPWARAPTKWLWTQSQLTRMRHLDDGLKGASSAASLRVLSASIAPGL